MGFKNRVLYEKNQFYRGGGAQRGNAGIWIYIAGKSRHPVQNGGDNRKRCKIRGGGLERYFQSRYLRSATSFVYVFSSGYETLFPMFL